MAALAVMAGIILLASGCGGSSSSGSDGSLSAGSSNVAKAVAFADCMRAHGVDVSVGGNGGLSSSGSAHSGAQQAGALPQTVQSAQSACRHLLPNGGQPSQAQQQNNLKQALKYVACMRSHGVPDFPDPSSNGTYNLPQSVNMQGSVYQAASNACQSLKPNSLFINQGPSS
jgi:hypothetical protein